MGHNHCSFYAVVEKDVEIDSNNLTIQIILSRRNWDLSDLN